MSESRIAYRYAKSLLELAQEKGQLEPVNNDMLMLHRAIEGSAELALLLRNPIVSTDKKRKILTVLFEGKVTEMTMAFYNIMVKKGREAYLYEVTKQFHLLYNSLKHIAEATLVTTVPVSEALRNTVTDFVKEQTGEESVELHEVINKDLLGGFVLRVGDRQIDDSVSTKLKELKQQFSKNPYVAEI